MPEVRVLAGRGIEINVYPGSLSQEIDCKACGASWYDIYKLVDIEKR